MNRQGTLGISIAALVGAMSGALGGYLSANARADSLVGEARSEREGSGDGETNGNEGAPHGVATGAARASRSDNQRIAALERRVSLLTAALARGDSELVEGEANEEHGELDSVDVADPVFEAAVLDIMDREEERRDDERESRRNDLVAERGRQLSSRLAQTLGLSPAQQERIAKVVTDHFNSFRELRSDDAPNRPVTRRDWQERMEQINETAMGKLREVLTPAQFEQYEQLDPDDQISFGWGRGGRVFERSERPSDDKQGDADNPGR